MIPNDFEEYYDRLETPFNFNYSKLFTNSIGEIILSSNYVLDNKNISFRGNNFIGNNKTPKTTNLLIDSVTFLSTNRNLDNFSPFKFRFGGNLDIDFSGPNISTVENYGYIRNNNLGVLTNRFSNRRVFSFIVKEDIDYDDVRYHYASSGRGLYICYKIDGENSYRLYYVELGNYISYRGSNSITNDNRILSLDNFIDTDLVELGGTSDFTFLLTKNRVNSMYGITALQEVPWDDPLNVPLSEPVLLPVVVKVTNRVFQVFEFTYPTDPPTPLPLSAFCYSRFYFYYWGKSGINNVLYVIRYNHSYTYIAGNNDYLPERFETIAIRVNNVFVPNITAINADRYFISKKLYALSDVGDIYEITITDIGFDTRLIFSTGLQGGNFLYTDRSESTSDSLTYIVGKREPPPPPLPIPDVPYVTTFLHFPSNKKYSYNGLKLNLVKKRINHIQFPFENSFRAINSVDGDEYIYSTPSENNTIINSDIKILGHDLNRYFSSSLLKGSELDGFDLKQLRLLYVLNEDYNKPPVTKYTYHYDGDRVFSNININSGFNFELISNPEINMKDLEIFKIIIDVRYRYSKDQINPYEVKKVEEEPEPPDLVTQCIEDCDPNIDMGRMSGLIMDCSTDKCREDKKDKKSCFIKCNRSVGSTSRVLGYVGDDFTVSKFLNIYTGY